ncbi:MAG: hypothetical protein GY835_16670 [bacterium]|nr:hypothetical protein [bacterium]
MLSSIFAIYSPRWKMIIPSLIVSFLSGGVTDAHVMQDGEGVHAPLYLGEDPPGDDPRLFAPGIVSVPGASDYVITFSQDGHEIYWSRGRAGVMTCWLDDNGWSEPVPADFGRCYPGGEVFVMADDNHLLMNRYSQLDNGQQGGIYRLSRLATGSNPSWGDPQLLIAKGMRATATTEGVIFVTDITHHLEPKSGKDAGVIARHAPTDNGMSRTSNPGGGVNTEHSEAHPFVAPDESYVIFDSSRPGGKGDSDLYISYRLTDGNWSEAINLTDLNTPYSDWGPTVSPDGKHLFFTRNMTGGGDIYWVSSRFIEEMKPASTTGGTYR